MANSSTRKAYNAGLGYGRSGQGGPSTMRPPAGQGGKAKAAFEAGVQAAHGQRRVVKPAHPAFRGSQNSAGSIRPASPKGKAGGGGGKQRHMPAGTPKGGQFAPKGR